MNAVTQTVYQKDGPISKMRVKRLFYQKIQEQPWELNAIVTQMKVLQVLGKGSFATVSLAEKNGQLVAVKSMSVQKYNKKLAENLMSEIQILKALSHPHIVALYDLIVSKFYSFFRIQTTKYI
jgi:serine/threonine protein kinase